MKKIILFCTFLFIGYGKNQLIMAIDSNPISKESSCLTINADIKNLEKDLLEKNKLLASRKQEIEKLSPESTAIKMKLTSESFVIAAESETTQNWIEAKKKEKATSCKHYHNK
jgi:valyl-tRNA synthetase